MQSGRDGEEPNPGAPLGNKHDGKAGGGAVGQTDRPSIEVAAVPMPEQHTARTDAATHSSAASSMSDG